MVKSFDQEGLNEIVEIVRLQGAEGITAPAILKAMASPPPMRTLQFRLKHLVERHRLIKLGERRGTRYVAARSVRAAGTATGGGEAKAAAEASVVLPLSSAGLEIQRHVSQALGVRKPVGYDRSFLDAYRPNKIFYLTQAERTRLREVGTQQIAQQPAGTYAKQILSRLLIDLAWNSSRLEGNTYSLLDTRRLINLGQEAKGKDRLEAQMILNHKDAIEFLVGGAEDIGFNRMTILNLHALLANNLLADPDAAGRLRRIPVLIDSSAFHPLEVPQLIEECFQEILAKASCITDPFEQAFFVMVQLPYLQPFDDVNKRVSRLAANIPMIRGNLAPLSFTDVPQDSYVRALLGVYELRRTELLRDVFIWAYERSADRYRAVRQSLGEPDVFRMQYRSELRAAVGSVVRSGVSRKKATAYLAKWAKENIRKADRDKFVETAEDELLGLHEGNFARYQLRPSEFQAWQKIWNGR